MHINFDESSYAVTWGSLRMRSRPPPPMQDNSSLMDILMVKRALGHTFDGKKGLGAQFWG